MRCNWHGEDKPEDLLNDLKRDVEQAGRARNLQELLGIEGVAAARYISARLPG